MPDKIAHVVYGTDANMWPHLFVSLYSLLVNNPQRRWHVTIICDTPDETFAAHLTWLRRQQQNLEDVALRPLAELGADATGLPVMRHLTAATYYRLWISHAVPADADRALYLDCDTVVRGSVEPLLGVDLGNCILAAADNGMGGADGAKLGLPKAVTYFNAGVLLIDLDRWRASDAEMRVRRFIATHPHKLKWADQDALNAVLYGERLKVAQTFNWQDGRIRGWRAAVRHYAGARKPWNETAIPLPTLAYWRYRQRTPYALPAAGWGATAAGVAGQIIRLAQRRGALPMDKRKRPGR